MEKDFTEESSDSNDASGEEEKDEELSKIEKMMILRAKMKSLDVQLKKEREKLNASLKAIEYLEEKDPRFQPLPLECLVSPIQSPTHKSQYLSEDAFGNFPFSTVLAEGLEQSFAAIYRHKETLAKQSEVISNSYESFEETGEAQFNILRNSPSKMPDNETHASCSYNKSDFPTDWEIIKTNEKSDRYYVGKGKEAANPAFRYKKRSKIVSSCDSLGKADNPRYDKSSKTNVSSSESLDKDSPVKRSEEAFGSLVSKTLDSRSPKAGLNRISPVIKRKVSDSKERDSHEICAKTLEISKLSGNHADDDLKIAKKLKFEDEDKIRKRSPSLTAFLSQTNYKSIDLADFMDQYQIDQTSNEREQLILPSTSGLSNVVGCISTSEESSLTSGSEDELLSERGVFPHEYKRTDVPWWKQ